MTATQAERLERWLRVLVALVAVFVMLLFVVAALRRLRYPYELEELEGYVFLIALRVFHGQPIYVRPSLAFIPYMYPPGYYYVAAALGRVMGMTLATMRMVSIVSTLGCFATIAGLVWSETKRWMPALAAAGLYAGCYVVCEEWFDLGRLDSLFVLLVLLAVLATRRAHPVLAALVWLLAFATKQSILPVAFAMLCCEWPRWRRVASGLTVLGAGALGYVAWMNHATQGWFSFYVFAVPKANSDLSARTLVVFWPETMFRPLLFALMVIVAAAVLTRPRLTSVATRQYAGALLVAPLFWVVYAHGGSTRNALMPVYAVVAVLFGLALARLLAWLAQQDAAVARPAAVALLVGVLAQEAAGIYNPGDYVPPRELRSSIAQVIETVKAQPGDVFVTQHPFYALLAGKRASADLVAIHDALRPARSDVRTMLSAELRTALDGHAYGAILLDEPKAIERMETSAGGDTAWEGYYNSESRVRRTELKTRPDWLLTHCEPGAAECGHEGP